MKWHINITCFICFLLKTKSLTLGTKKLQRASFLLLNIFISFLHFSLLNQPNPGEREMSVQPQQIQQPPLVYPNTFTSGTPESSSSSLSHSGGSFGSVFIVLAVILVVSALACVFGRLCNRRSHKQQNKPPKHGKDKPSTKSHHIRPVEREPRESRDLEFGFDPKRMPMGKPLGGKRGDIELGFDHKRIPSVKHGVRFELPEDGEVRGETRHGGPHIEFRPGQ